MHEDPFIRTAWLLGADAMQKLKASRVIVVGIGGVGAYAVEALARSGVGHLVLVDPDRVEVSNLNRQLPATRATLGQLKVDVMRARVLAINPEAAVEVRTCFFTPGDPDGLITPDLDYVIDAIDTVTSKVGLIAKAKELGLRVISCMGAGNKLDPTRFEVADISQTSVCPLSKAVRQQLRKQGIESVKVVYSREKPFKPREGGRSPGSVAFVPSVAGLIMAGEVIKDITGIRAQPD
ncbi:MAG: tRNA threonylcarbamoyladenosine dehydratase [Clostridiales bacterium]|nr:tRNA threonylcarbamoyladenosine dehydratase [Clostridiales bacterium]